MKRSIEDIIDDKIDNKTEDDKNDDKIKDIKKVKGIDDDLISHLRDNGAEIKSIGKTSWIAIIKNFYLPSDELFNKTWNEHPKEFLEIKMYDRMVKIPRYQQAYGKSYSYSGSQSKSIEATELVKELMDKVNELLIDDKVKFNMCLCNWYEPKHYIGAHSDDTRQLHHRSPIASISWGYTRTFVLNPKSKDGISHTIQLQSGDLVIMGGDCQLTHKHEITKLSTSQIKELNDKGNRINFTFRCFR